LPICNSKKYFFMLSMMLKALVVLQTKIVNLYFQK